MTEIEIWTKWESQTVNGLFPLRRFLGRSNHSVVFLTECKAQNLSKAAIKLVPADALADTQLSHWKRIAALSHPHLIRVLDMGRCKLGGHPFLFVVMEYAEQSLAQILPHRPLTADEAQEMLTPTLSALAYLHGKHLIQAQLKPPNFLVVDDQLKLASDTIRAVGEAWPSDAKRSLYDPPEARTSVMNPAGDIWGLGVTLIEALTQSPPSWPNDRSDKVSLPATIPPEFADTLRRCLRRNPLNRPTLSELEAQLALTSHSDRVPQPAAPEALPGGEEDQAVPEPDQIAPQLAQEPPQVSQPTSQFPQSTPLVAQNAPLLFPAATAPAPDSLSARTAVRQSVTRWLAPAVAISLVLLLVIWAAIRPFAGRTKPPPPSSAPIQASVPQSAPQTTAPANQVAPASTASVIHQEIPVLSRGARGSIRGEIKVTVQVSVDRAGNVVAGVVENRGPSKYFARVAADAAKKWRFAPADTPAIRQWLLQFEFSRAGAAAQATPRATRPAS
jgi:serine/threonine protein kinase